MRDDADFAAYLSARWPFVVRTLVLLGAPQPEAEQVAREAFARCYASWARVRKVDDVDAHVYATVLDGWHRSRRHHRHPAGVVVDEPDEDVTEGLLRRALEADLAGLAPEDREVLVLRFVAELGESQVAEVLDVPVGTVATLLPEALARVDLEALRATTGR